MTRNKPVLRSAAAIVGALAITALALPALAATGDVVGTKSNNAGGPLEDGESTTYTVELRNETPDDQDDIQAFDVMENGLNYVPQSTHVVLEFYQVAIVAYDNLPQDGGATRSDYDFDTDNYWADNWTEVNDGAADPDAGDVRRTGNPMDQNAIRLSGLAAAPGDVLDNPGITRTVDPAKLAGLLDAELTFETNDLGLTADDRLGVWASVNGGTSWTFLEEFLDGAADEQRVVDLSAFVSSPSLMLRFGVSWGAYASDDELWSIDEVQIVGAYDMSYELDNIPGGSVPDLTDGTPDNLILLSDNVDIPSEFNFNGGTYTSRVAITYDAVVDTSQTDNWDDELENWVYWRSASYTDDAYNSSSSWVAVDYAPQLDLTVSSNGPLLVGQPVIITVVLEHGDGSDGSPVCATNIDILDLPVGAISGSFSGDTDTDECLDDGETWTFVITYPPFATSGAFPFAVAFEGATVNADEGEGGLEVDLFAEGDTTVTVTLAATGPASGSAAGLAAALMALGTAALVVARRRTA